MNKVCKHCNSPEVISYTIKSGRQKGSKVEKSVCKECDLKVRKKIPLFFNYDFLYNIYHTENKTLEWISNEYNITVPQVKNWLGYYGVEIKVEKKVCKHCGSSDIITYIRKDGAKVEKRLCKECDNKKRKRVPVEFCYDYLYNEHHTVGLNTNEIAEKYSITENQVKNWLKYYGVEVRIVCKVCGTSENLLKRDIKNQFGDCGEATCEICKKCFSENLSIVVSEGLKKINETDTEEQKEIKRKNRSEGQFENMEKRVKKRKETWNKKTKEELQEIGEKISKTKQNRTEEQEKERIEKFQNTMSEKSEEELIERRKKMGAHHNAKASMIFSHLEEILVSLNINHKIRYKLLNKDRKVILREKPINVSKISKTCECRFLDCYIKINNREINFEFDEDRHRNSIAEDFIREQEILTIKPNLEIYRIPEELYFGNKDQVVFDLLNIVIGNFNIVEFDYSPISKRNPKVPL